MDERRDGQTGCQERRASSTGKKYVVQRDNHGRHQAAQFDRGLEGRVEDIYQCDTGHNALCLIG